jgi:hypothetical protein
VYLKDKLVLRGWTHLIQRRIYIGQKDKASYPTPNIAVSGNHTVIAWANGVVTVETISEDGTLQPTVLGVQGNRHSYRGGLGLNQNS